MLFGLNPLIDFKLASRTTFAVPLKFCAEAWISPASLVPVVPFILKVLVFVS